MLKSASDQDKLYQTVVSHGHAATFEAEAKLKAIFTLKASTVAVNFLGKFSIFLESFHQRKFDFFLCDDYIVHVRAHSLACRYMRAT